MSKQSGFLSRIIYLAAALGFFALDVATKLWARGSLRFGDSISVIPGFLTFIYAENNGVAFSQLSNGGEFGRWALSAVAAVAALGVLYYLRRTPITHRLRLSACAFLLAGILGNLVNRAVFGFVIDWIDVQFGTWHYPTFNFADIAICMGAGLLILNLFIFSGAQSVDEKI